MISVSPPSVLSEVHVSLSYSLPEVSIVQIVPILSEVSALSSIAREIAIGVKSLHVHTLAFPFPFPFPFPSFLILPLPIDLWFINLLGVEQLGHAF